MLLLWCWCPERTKPWQPIGDHLTCWWHVPQTSNFVRSSHANTTLNYCCFCVIITLPSQFPAEHVLDIHVSSNFIDVRGEEEDLPACFHQSQNKARPQKYWPTTGIEASYSGMVDFMQKRPQLQQTPVVQGTCLEEKRGMIQRFGVEKKLQAVSCSITVSAKYGGSTLCRKKNDLMLFSFDHTDTHGHIVQSSPLNHQHQLVGI